MNSFNITVEDLSDNDIIDRYPRVIYYLAHKFLTKDERDACSAGSQWERGYINRLRKKLIKKLEEVA